MAQPRRRGAVPAARSAAPRVRPPRPPAGPRRWLGLAALLGLLSALVWQAPASWLADAVWRVSQHRVLLAQAQGTWHDGRALLVLAGGRGSREATLLPGLLHWRIRLGQIWRGRATVEIDWPAVAPQPLRVQAQWGPSGWQARFGSRGSSDWNAALPLALLDGLGTPWNTLALRGTAQLQLRALTLQVAAGRLRIDGDVVVRLPDVSSRLSTLSPLGSYELRIAGRGAEADIRLHSSSGPLLLDGRGQWTGQTLHFAGTARAAPGSEAALATLLPILGQREGDQIRIAL